MVMLLYLRLSKVSNAGLLTVFTVILHSGPDIFTQEEDLSIFSTLQRQINNMALLLNNYRVICHRDVAQQAIHSYCEG